MNEIESLFRILEKRRSIRRYTPEPVPPAMIEKCLQAAILAPNSSNTQTWDFYWLRSPEAKAAGVRACLSQSAARTAQELVVITANPKAWRRSQGSLIQWVKDAKAPAQILLYYERLVPFVYRWGFLNMFAPFKWIAANSVGLFRPIVRGPYSRRDIQEVAVKSAALAAENFVLAATAQGLQTCMMEGFDDCRLRRFLKLGSATKIVMVISVGFEAERGTWAPRHRLPLRDVVHEV
ncbi:MAG: nitroreductase family protein [Bdellovibrionaceae bacterium]|nr:nitroreductase family protein [Pseudobdellovibrionaceae bacterium]